MSKIKFNVHDKVKLPKSINVDLEGIVISIWITDNAIRYEVRYFWQGKAQEVYFYGWELEKE